MTYLTHFNLSKNPFTTKFYFSTAGNIEALSRFNVLLETGGIMHLYGTCGVGKSVLLNKFIQDLATGFQPVLINYSALTPFCFLLQLSAQLGLPVKNNTSNLVTQIHSFINSSNQNILFIIDEAQELQPSSLNSIKMIINPYSSSNKVGLIISSLPEMKDRLSANPAFKQRINFHHFLPSLDTIESKKYFLACLNNSNCQLSIFADDAIDKIIQITEGIPRIINKFGSLCLLAAASSNKKFIDLQIIENVLAELALY